MPHAVTTALLTHVATTTHLHAAQMRQGRGIIGWWRERRFAKSIDHFAETMRGLPQAEVETAPEASLRHIGDMVDAIVRDVEEFIAGHRSTNLKRVERDRFLVRQIYDLRASYEKISHRITPREDMTDLRWEMQHQRPPSQPR